MLVVTDQTQAYLDVPADGTSSYIRIDPVPRDVLAAADAADAPYRTVYVRADGDGHAGRMTSVVVNAPRSLYLKVRANDTVRLWIAESAGSVGADRRGSRQCACAVLLRLAARGRDGGDCAAGGVVAARFAAVADHVGSVESQAAAGVRRGDGGGRGGDAGAGGRAAVRAVGLGSDRSQFQQAERVHL